MTAKIRSAGEALESTPQAQLQESETRSANE